jgi:hypothetical protein
VFYPTLSTMGRKHLCYPGALTGRRTPASSRADTAQIASPASANPQPTHPVEVHP